MYPLTLSSILGARAIATFNWIVDIAYIDSAHELGETLVELFLYYDLLRPGGLLMGDDFYMFPAVAHDVTIFASCKGLKVDFLPEEYFGQWVIQKPL